MLFKNRRAMYEIYIKFLFLKCMLYNMVFWKSFLTLINSVTEKRFIACLFS